MGNRFTHVYDQKGRHRIELIIGTEITVTGEWATYPHVAILDDENKTYVAFSGYYDGTEIDPNIVYQLKAVSE